MIAACQCGFDGWQYAQQKATKRGKHVRQYHGVKQKPAIVSFHRVIETVDVVLHKEAVDKLLTVNLIRRDIPWGCDQQEYDPAGNIKNRPQEFLSVATAQVEQASGHKRNSNCHWAFSQCAECHEYIDPNQQAARRRLRIEIHGQHGGGQNHVEQAVSRGNVGNGIDACSGRCHKRGGNGGLLVCYFAGEGKDRKHPQNASQSGWQPEYPGICAEGCDRGGLEPVNQNGFIETDAIIEVSGDEITTLEHSPCRFAECAFVMVKQQEAVEVHSHQDDDKPQQPERQCSTAHKEINW